MTRTEATIEDLYNAPNDYGTYELVDGELVHMSPTGIGPGRVSFHICAAFARYEEETGSGIAAYHADAPNTPTHSVMGEIADAEPALPSWRVAVNTIFRM